MNHRYKRIIAREFLVIVSVLSIAGLLFLSTFLYNLYITNKILQNSAALTSNQVKLDSLNKYFHRKQSNQKWFYDQFDLPAPNNPQKTFDRLYQILKRDSLRDKWNHEWKNTQLTKALNELGFETSDEFGKFINSNHISNADKNTYKTFKKLTIENHKLKSENEKFSKNIFTPEQRTNFFWNALFLLLSVAFIMRYLFYGVMWSISMLKHK